MGIIDLVNVNYSYSQGGKPALQDINLSVTEGEFLAVMGENTAGKTTFCRLLNGIIPHLIKGGQLSGTVTVDGQCTSGSSVPELAFKTGMVLDDPDVQAFTSSVFQEVAFGPENILLPPDEIIERVKLALSLVGLDGFEDRLPSTLSGGERQRLSIAAALAMKGKILVLDEPLCRLDPEGAAEVMAVLKDIRKKHHITIVMATHDSEKIIEFADRVCILNNGKITALDTAENIFENNALLEANGIEPVKITRENNHGGHGEHRGNIEYSRATTPDNNNCINSAVNIKNISFLYPGGTGIKNINIDIMENDFAAIIGKNGCGKTTLLKCITGLLRPCEGDIYIHGKNTKDLKVSDISKEAGFVMQNPDNQLFTDSVYKEAAFALKNKRLSKNEIKQRVKDALEIVGLYDMDAFPHALSRSDRAKTVIACVLAMGCKILIFDEVDVGSDYSTRIKIMDIMRDLHKKGFTIIFVTHNMTLVEEYALRVIKL